MEIKENKKEKKQLRVLFGDNRTDTNIVNFLKQRYEIEVLDLGKITIGKNKFPDLIIFSGGEDVNPSSYGEPVGKFTHINKKRDEIERHVFEQFSYGTPKLGICRGAQFLTVMSGGKLIQHVENHNNSNHIIRIPGWSAIRIKSDHHQMMYPYNMNKKNYELYGYSENFLSGVYLNGHNKNIELPEKFLEPEIVYYPGTTSLCIQSHPEWEIGSNDSNMLLSFIDAKLLKRLSKEGTNNSNPFLPPINDVQEEIGSEEPYSLETALEQLEETVEKKLKNVKLKKESNYDDYSDYYSNYYKEYDVPDAVVKSTVTEIK